MEIKVFTNYAPGDAKTIQTLIDKFKDLDISFDLLFQAYNSDEAIAMYLLSNDLRMDTIRLGKKYKVSLFSGTEVVASSYGDGYFETILNTLIKYIEGVV